jgi:hypothetical protein
LVSFGCSAVDAPFSGCCLISPLFSAV